MVLFNLIALAEDPCSDPLIHSAVVLDLGSGEGLAGRLPKGDLSNDDGGQQSSGALFQADPAGDLRLLTLDRDGRGQSWKVDLPRDSGRKAWWESR